jgi:small subunit ribosomal protein S21
MLVYVRDNNIEYALKVLKRRMQRAGVYQEIRLRRNYLKPSEEKAKMLSEKSKKISKFLKKRMEREGY